MARTMDSNQFRSTGGQINYISIYFKQRTSRFPGRPIADCYVCSLLLDQAEQSPATCRLKHGGWSRARTTATQQE